MAPELEPEAGMEEDKAEHLGLCEPAQPVEGVPVPDPGPVPGPDPGPALESHLDTQLGPHPGSPPLPRQSTRQRRPNMVFTYPSLGQPAYQPHPMVNTVHVQPTQSPLLHYSLLYHPFHPTTLASYPYPPVPYLTPYIGGC